MELDTHIPLGQLYSSNDEIRAAMVEVAQYQIEDVMLRNIGLTI